MQSTPKWNSGTNQQVINFLLASKGNYKYKKDHHALISTLNRGRLSFITDNMQRIMLIAIKYFRRETILLQKHQIEFKLICQGITKDATV